MPDKRRKALSAQEVANFIYNIPNLAAEWRPPDQGGTRRLKADEIAARVAKAFQEAGLIVTESVTL